MYERNPTRNERKGFLFVMLLLAANIFPFQQGYENTPSSRITFHVEETLLEHEIREASISTNVPVEYLRGVIAWECGNDFSKVVKNRNGTVDRGPGLNSRWLHEFSWRFNGGQKIDPHSYSSIKVVARILANNYKIFHDWNLTLTSYRWGVKGTIMRGVDVWYVDNVRQSGKLNTIF
jgi:hypothetical protein